MMGYFTHVFKLPIKFFGTKNTGEILTRFQDAGTVKDVLTGSALTVLIDIFMIVVVGAVLISQSPTLFAIVLAIT